MKNLILAAVVCVLCGCASQVIKPYSKEVTYNKDGSITVRETSADKATGVSFEGLLKKK
jgi:uncharacterized protein YceK